MDEPSSPTDEPTADPPVRAVGAAFPVVGVGASAGGLDALTQLLQALPPNTGMAFVIVQHLAPARASSLVEILARATKMPVCEVRDEPAVEPNRVYVIPPGRDMIIAGGKLQLLPQVREARHRGIDQFFRSLAEDSAHQAIGVVLSGSATDGTLGLEVIKAEGGVTFAQDESAQHDSMPKSAVASGCVDFVLPPEGIAKEIARIARHPYVALKSPQQVEEETPGHGRIAEIVRSALGVDFTHYKAATMQRRIHRRMMVHKIETLAEYEAHMNATPGEVEALYQDVLIGVTSFFRNPEAFETLAKTIFPKLIAERTRQEPVRIWTLGCSTGEEAYSLAILFAECAEAAKSTAQLQMFASDLNASGIETARVGRYPRSIAHDVSPERLRQFFAEEDGGYRVSKSIRERVVFSRHNVLADPPFSRMDFISCRNLLIYLEPVLQQQVMPLLHYALKVGGHLWLGSSESVGTSRALFEVEDAKHKIFSRRPGPSPTGTRFRPELGTTIFPTPAPGPRELPLTTLHRDAERLLVAKYAPPGIVVNAALQVVQFRGETGAYLAPSSGLASYDVLKMLREGLLVPVRAALARAQSEGGAVREEGARVRGDSGFRELVIEVIPLPGGAGREAGFLILFDEGVTPSHAVPTRDARSDSENPDATEELPRVQQELAATRDYLQSVIEQQDSVNEELQSANEEAQSSNEEMQSVNEELETSKEEIQSSNEELATVNDELQNRNSELSTLNNDLHNVLASTQLAIVIVSRDLRIRRFTPMAERTLNLAGGDVGRPLHDIKLSLTVPNLAPLLREVIDTLSASERDVQDAQGRWFSLRARPYLTQDGKIDGAVVTLVDVDALRRARDFSETIVANVRTPLVVLDATLRVKIASRAFYTHFRVAAEDTESRHFYDLGNRQWDIPALRTLLEEVLPREQAVEDYEVRHDFEQLGPRTILVSARRLVQTPVDAPLIILSLVDITERERTARDLAEQARLLDLTNDAIVVRDMEGRVAYWNAGAEKLYGWTREEALGKHTHDLLKTECAVPFAQIDDALHRDGHWTGEFVHTKRDGGRITVLARKSLDRDSHGNPASVLQTLTDITERKRGEAALRRSELRFRTAVSTVSDLVWTNNADGEMEGEQPGWENFTGQKQAESQGYGWAKAVHPDDAQPTIDAWHQAVAEKKPFVFEHRVRRADGAWRLCSVRAAPVFGEDGAILEWVGVHTDITEQKGSEEILRQSEERHRALITASSDVIYRMNADWSEIGPMDGRDLVASSTASSRTWLEDNIFPEDRPQLLAAIEEAIRTKSLFKLEHRVRRADGSAGWTVSRAVPLLDARGEIVEWFGTASDITERRRLADSLVARAEELARADRSKDEFLAMLAHELRNPLAPLRNAAELLKVENDRDPERAHAQGIVVRQIDNMSRMLDDLLDVSRITEGKIVLRKKPVALEEILTAATSLARSNCAAHEQELAVSLPKEPVYLDADATRLEQVFGNLLGNACKYSGHGCHIALTAEVVDSSSLSSSSSQAVAAEGGKLRGRGRGRGRELPPREVIVRVRDDGAGIDPEVLPHIFDLFVQASRTLDRSHGGLGIGLTLVERLVSLHGGSIEAHSEGLGHGAEFVVRLPILAKAPPPAPLPPPPAVRETPRRILIVDDNTDSARSLATLQKRRGHETHTAFTGPEAVTAAAEFRPEFILLDIGLPGMDGFEVARQIRAMPELKGVFIIAMSGYGRDEDRVEAKLAGFDEYMVKPVDLDTLRDWLGSRA